MSTALTPNDPFRNFHSIWKSLIPRSTWNEQLQRSGLPDSVKQLIRQVITQTRLLWFEKNSIACELISHFEDGFDRTTSFQQLIEDFGEPDLTATLIRRSKIRNRPMFMKIFKGMAMCFGAVVALYVVVAIFFHIGRPNPVTDYMRDVNYKNAGMDEAEKAWAIYRPLWTKYGFCEGGGFRCESIFEPVGNSTRMLTPEDENWPEAVAEIGRYDELLDGMRAAAKLPYLGLELQSNTANYSDEDFAALFPALDPSEDVVDNSSAPEDSLIATLLPHAQSFRKAARLFKFDTRIAISEGDSARAAENIKTTLGLARHASEAPLLVCGLVGVAVSEIGFQQLEESLLHDPEFFSEEELEDLQATIEAIDFRTFIDYQGERAAISDIVQRCYTDNGKGDGRMTNEGISIMLGAQSWLSGMQNQPEEYPEVRRTVQAIAAPASMFLVASRKETMEKMEELIGIMSDDADKPFWLSRSAKPNGWAEVEGFFQDNQTKHLILSMMMPAAQQVNNAMYRTRGRQEGILAALAIHRYYNKYETWPNDVNQVAPEFINEFPVDTFDGSLVKFTYQDDGLLVYSVGNDYDDDGGKPHGRAGGGKFVPKPRAHVILGPPDKNAEGDWILWPQTVD